MLVYLTHPEHGTHIAYNRIEVEECRKHGWQFLTPADAEAAGFPASVPEGPKAAERSGEPAASQEAPQARQKRRYRRKG